MERTNLCYNGVEYYYERSGCVCHDWPCRCTRIDKTWIEEIEIDKVISELCTSNYNIKNLSYIDFYCFDRICRFFKIWDEDCYEIEVTPGYYGEEIDGVYFENETIVISEFNKILALDSDVDKIKYVLQLEYGYVIESIENATIVSVVECDPKVVISPQKEYYHRLEKDVIDSYKDYKAPCAVCRKQGDKYLIIDGYHRVAANQDEKSINIIVIE